MKPKIKRISELGKGSHYSREFSLSYGRRKMLVEVAVFRNMRDRKAYMGLTTASSITSKAHITIRHPENRAIIGFIYGRYLTPGVIAHECSHAIFEIMKPFQIKGGYSRRASRREESFCTILNEFTDFIYRTIGQIKP